MTDRFNNLMAAFWATALPMLVLFGLTMDLFAGERVEVRCGADGACELRRGPAVGPLHTVGRFTEDGVVGSSNACRSERHEHHDDIGFSEVEKVPPGWLREALAADYTYWVKLCQPGLWVVGWSGPSPEPDPDLVRRPFEVGTIDAPQPATAVWVPLSAREHQDFEISPFDDVAARRDGSSPWTLRYSTAHWLSFRWQLLITVAYLAAVGPGAMLVTRRLIRLAFPPSDTRQHGG